MKASYSNEVSKIVYTSDSQTGGDVYLRITYL